MRLSILYRLSRQQQRSVALLLPDLIKGVNESRVKREWTSKNEASRIKHEWVTYWTWLTSTFTLCYRFVITSTHNMQSLTNNHFYCCVRIRVLLLGAVLVAACSFSPTSGTRQTCAQCRGCSTGRDTFYLYRILPLRFSTYMRTPTATTNANRWRFVHSSTLFPAVARHLFLFDTSQRFSWIQ